MSEVISVTPLISPASPLVKANAAISAGIARPNICTSSASSDQPPKQAQNVLRSRGVTWRYQLNMILILISGTGGSREQTAPLRASHGNQNNEISNDRVV